MPFDSRQLRHLVTLQAQTTTQNPANGEKTSVWTTVEKVYADIGSASGRELMIAKSFSATASSVITIRHRPDVDSTWRVLFDGRTFGIDGTVDPNERKQTLKLYCTEVKPKGT